jgi:hypothetical protein
MVVYSSAVLSEYPLVSGYSVLVDGVDCRPALRDDDEPRVGDLRLAFPRGAVIFVCKLGRCRGVVVASANPKSKYGYAQQLVSLWTSGTIAFSTPDDGCLTRFYVTGRHSAPMSSQPSQPSGIETRTLACTFCDCRLTERLLALQSYPSEATSVPAGLPEDGGLTLCPDCASEVVILLTSWHPHRQPTIRTDASIGDAYQAVVETCSFCADRGPRAGLGIELYRRVGEELPAYATYTLCEPCQSVFGEFLRALHRESQP